MKESVSFLWIVAFFIIGALLGWLGLQLINGDARQAASTTAAAMQPPVARQRQPQVAAGTRTELKQQTGQRDTIGRPAPLSLGDKPAAHGEGAVKGSADDAASAAEPLRCDRERALKVREKAREFAEIFNDSELLKVRLRGEWDYYSDPVRRSFVAKFADSDTCLNGQSRSIDFYYQGKLYAHADPDKGVEFK